MTVFCALFAAACWANTLRIYVRLGRATEDRLPRMSLRNQFKTRVSCWKLKRSLEKGMRLVVLTGNASANKALLSTQLSLLLGRALLERDPHLAAAVQRLMSSTAGETPPVVISGEHLKRLAVAQWN